MQMEGCFRNLVPSLVDCCVCSKQVRLQKVPNPKVSLAATCSGQPLEMCATCMLTLFPLHPEWNQLTLPRGKSLGSFCRWLFFGEAWECFVGLFCPLVVSLFQKVTEEGSVACGLFGCARRKVETVEEQADWNKFIFFLAEYLSRKSLTRSLDLYSARTITQVTSLEGWIALQTCTRRPSRTWRTILWTTLSIRGELHCRMK